MQKRIARDILITRELARRPARPADYARENKALYSFIRRVAAAPDRASQALAETARQLCRADTAGVSLMETLHDGSEIFRWVALAGRLRTHIGEWTPRAFSPCGVCVDRRDPQLMRFPERHFTYLRRVNVPIVDCLVLPFYRGRRAIGAIWILAHSERRKFDREDLRAMTLLADIAGETVKLTERARTMAVADERMRLIETVHDSISGLFFEIGLNLDACLQQLDRQTPVRRRLLEVRRQTRGLFAGLRNAIRGLEVRKKRSREHLVDVVTNMAGGFGRLTGVTPHLALERNALKDLPVAVRSAIIALIREALSNTAKHAGAANVWITVKMQDGTLLFDICDDGGGAPEAVIRKAIGGDTEHFGLRTIHHRIGMLRGNIAFDNRQPTGFRISGHLPLVTGSPAERQTDPR